MEALFDRLASWVQSAAASSEVLGVWLSAELSDFVRFNRGKVRQAGHVQQAYGRLHLIRGARHVEETLTLSARSDEDVRRLEECLAGLREIVGGLPEDPHLLYSSEVRSTRNERRGALPTPEAAIANVIDGASGLDLVGFLATGPVYRGFANSLGQRNWHAVETFNLEWSLYRQADQAIKSSYAGFDWSAAELHARMSRARELYAALAPPPRTIQPGRYRTYLAPDAVKEITDMLGWGGFSARAQRLGQSCLMRMTSGEASLAPSLTMVEEVADGIAPAFQSDGFVRPGNIALIEKGRLAAALTSPRSAREFGIDHNGADGSESPTSLAMAAGDLPVSDALPRLDTGIYVGNLWYLNFSDRPACRMTGMTRFGTFWVEKGKIVAPLAVMRFDDTVYRMLGENLEALTVERDRLLEPLTYGERALASARLPGALIAEMAFTL